MARACRAMSCRRARPARRPRDGAPASLAWKSSRTLFAKASTSLGFAFRWPRRRQQRRGRPKPTLLRRQMLRFTNAASGASATMPSAKLGSCATACGQAGSPLISGRCLLVASRQCPLPRQVPPSAQPPRQVARAHRFAASLLRASTTIPTAATMTTTVMTTIMTLPAATPAAAAAAVALATRSAPAEPDGNRGSHQQQQ